MATSEYVTKPSKSGGALGLASSQSSPRRYSPTQAAVTSAMMMAADVLAVLFALCLASIFRFNHSYAVWLKSPQALWPGIALPLHARYLALFLVTLLLVNRHEGLYGALQTLSLWHELRRTIQACFTAGMLLCGAMYVMHDTTVSRAVVFYLLCLTTLFLATLRAFWRHSLHRRYKRGLDTRNVLIVGTSHVGNMMRKHIARNCHLGRTFKGFLKAGEGAPCEEAGAFVVGDLRQLKRLARRHFIDEIIVAEHCPTPTVVELVETARELDMEVLMAPSFYDNFTPETPIEYLGNFPVVALHRRNGRVVARLFKRVWDYVNSALLLLVLSPTLLVIALAIKLDSPGPVFYTSERVGKKGRTFRCIKFRTMVAGADRLKDSLAAHNERDGILFKIKDDPRVTPVGGILRKFSLDELPQLFNVLRGDMSLVGPRPPLASEVQRYELRHLRRLEVLPGLTGLWQVRARQDPSFERYVGLDLAYVERWSFWLDLKILVRTAEVVLRGTGS